MSQVAPQPVGTLSGLESEAVWDTELAYKHLKSCGLADSKRTAERRLHEHSLLPSELNQAALRDEHSRPPNTLVLAWAIEQTRKRRDRLLFAQLSPLPSGKPCLHANDARGARFWVPLTNLEPGTVRNALTALQQHIGKPISVFPHGALTGLMRNLHQIDRLNFCPQAYAPSPPSSLVFPALSATEHCSKHIMPTHLKRLEAESIQIIRTAATAAKNPAMLFSGTKDHCVMLHLARKAFFPSNLPLPLLHIDTRWQFQEMNLFCERMAHDNDLQLVVHTNPEAVEKNINPFDHGPVLHQKITQAEALKQAIDKHAFDLVMDSRRRDEPSPAGPQQIFTRRHHAQHSRCASPSPEIWQLYNTRHSADSHLCVSPLANWTELDTWHYIHLEAIPVPALYFAKQRAVVVRADSTLLIDDERCALLPGEKIQLRHVRFRTLSCYPLSSAIDSHAQSTEEILLEITRNSA